MSANNLHQTKEHLKNPGICTDECAGQLIVVNNKECTRLSSVSSAPLVSISYGCFATGLSYRNIYSPDGLNN